MDELLIWMGWAWLAWSALNAAIIVASQHLPVPRELVSYVRGVLTPVIVMHPSLVDRVTREEWMALYLHERGHVVNHHLRLNALRSVLLPWYPRTATQRWRQELEADRFVLDKGYGATLARALRKVSSHPLDLRRAELLDQAGERLANFARGTRAYDDEVRS